ncbi:MAG: hypothetical protein OXB86_05325 [Bdellovibrionales bacterium]|nr:hypothetical protein [Bdellovibrionales bacterium]
MFLATVYFWPRYLSEILGEQSPWISYLYTYGLGVLFFAFTTFWIFFSPSRNPKKRKQDTFWLFVLCGTLIYGMALHGFWIWFAVSYPFKG